MPGTKNIVEIQQTYRNYIETNQKSNGEVLDKLASIFGALAQSPDSNASLFSQNLSNLTGNTAEILYYDDDRNEDDIEKVYLNVNYNLQMMQENLMGALSGDSPVPGKNGYQWMREYAETQGFDFDAAMSQLDEMTGIGWDPQQLEQQAQAEQQQIEQPPEAPQQIEQPPVEAPRQPAEEQPQPVEEQPQPVEKKNTFNPAVYLAQEVKKSRERLQADLSGDPEKDFTPEQREDLRKDLARYIAVAGLKVNLAEDAELADVTQEDVDKEINSDIDDLQDEKENADFQTLMGKPTRELRNILGVVDPQTNQYTLYSDEDIQKTLGYAMEGVKKDRETPPMDEEMKYRLMNLRDYNIGELDPEDFGDHLAAFMAAQEMKESKSYEGKSYREIDNWVAGRQEEIFSSADHQALIKQDKETLKAIAFQYNEESKTYQMLPAELIAENYRQAIAKIKTKQAEPKKEEPKKEEPKKEEPKQEEPKQEEKREDEITLAAFKEKKREECVKGMKRCAATLLNNSSMDDERATARTDFKRFLTTLLAIDETLGILNAESKVGEDRREALTQNLEKSAKDKDDGALQDMIDGMDGQQLSNLVFEKADGGVRLRGTADIAADIAAEKAKQPAIRGEVASLAAEVEATKSTPLYSSVKSWFVGNSAEYNRALQKMKDCGESKATKAEAIQAVRQYLDIRSSKVRNTQFGRDRFDGMMKSLATLMGPMDFANYCKSVDTARTYRDKSYKGVTNPYSYLSPEKQKEYDKARMKADEKDGDFEKKKADFLAALRKNGSEKASQAQRQEWTEFATEHPSVRQEIQSILQEKGVKLTLPAQPQQQRQEERGRNSGSLMQHI